MIERGLVRGALGGAVVVFVVVTLPLQLGGDAMYAPITLVFVAAACLPGAVCGALSGWLLERRHSWFVAAGFSSAAAVVAVIAVMLLLSDGQLTNNLPAALGLAGALGGGATLVAVWQSWAMARRRDRVAHPALSTRA